MIRRSALVLALVLGAAITGTACKGDSTMAPVVNSDSLKTATANKTASYIAVVSSDGSQNAMPPVAGKLSAITENRGNPIYLRSPSAGNAVMIPSLVYGEPYIVGTATQYSSWGNSITITASFDLVGRTGGVISAGALSFHNEAFLRSDGTTTWWYGDTAYMNLAPLVTKVSDKFKPVVRSIDSTLSMYSMLSIGVGLELSCQGEGTTFIVGSSDGVTISETYDIGGFTTHQTAPTLYKVDCYRLSSAPANIVAAVASGQSSIKMTNEMTTALRAKRAELKIQ